MLGRMFNGRTMPKRTQEVSMEVQFETKITAGDLYDYMLHHSYTSMSGLLGTMVGALMIVGFFMNMQNVILLIVGVVVLLYLPWNLFLKSRQQAINNPAFKKPLTYLLDEEGIHVSQEDVTQMQKWEDMVKAVSTRNSIIVYTSKMNASIFPRRDMGEKSAKVIEMISTHMPPAKVKIRW